MMKKNDVYVNPDCFQFITDFRTEYRIQRFNHNVENYVIRVSYFTC